MMDEGICHTQGPVFSVPVPMTAHRSSASAVIHTNDTKWQLRAEVDREKGWLGNQKLGSQDRGEVGYTDSREPIKYVGKTRKRREYIKCPLVREFCKLSETLSNNTLLYEKSNV